MTLEEIAALPFLRQGGENFDCAYAVRIWDARNRLALYALMEADPNSLHESPDGLLHYVPNGEGGGTIWHYAEDSKYTP